MKKLLAHALLFLVLAALHCTPSSTSSIAPDYIMYLDDGDSLACKIVRGDILTTRILTAGGDTLTLDNASVDRIISLRSGSDVTGRYIDRDVVKIELAKRRALKSREKLKGEIAAGRRKNSELRRIPFAVLFAEMEKSERGTPQVALTILNLSEKKISLVKTRIYCYDGKGRPQEGTKGRGHIFDASSRIPIGPGEDFTTTLLLRNYPRTKKAKLEIHYLEFADRTWWKGKVEETAE